MKLLKLFCLLLLCTFALGVSRCDMTDPVTNLAIKNAARSVGYAVANSRTTADDKAVEAAWELYTKGTLNEVAMTELLSRLKNQNPLIVFAALDLVEAMGAVINKNQGTVLDLSGIPAEAWTLVETAYKQGYALGKADKKAGITRAVP